MSIEQQLDDMRKQYQEFIEQLKETKKRKKEKETEWVEWATSHGGYFGNDDTNIAIFPIGDDYKLDVLKTYGEDVFVYQKYNIKIDENYDISLTRVLRDYTVYSYDDVLKGINEAKLYIKRFKEIKKCVELQGDFQ